MFWILHAFGATSPESKIEFVRDLQFAKEAELDGYWAFTANATTSSKLFSHLSDLTKEHSYGHPESHWTYLRSYTTPEPKEGQPTKDAQFGVVQTAPRKTPEGP